MTGANTRTGLAERVQAWIAEDPDPRCREELRGLLAAGDRAELERRFAATLEFGTAGLRGRLEAGPARVNRATVRQATAALAAHLRGAAAAAERARVVVGHDARHGSAALAQEAGRVLTGAGLHALDLPGQVPTPLLAFAVRRLGCAAGVMITASHNPPQDNGYKVYLGDGAQLAPPIDAEIAARIRAVGPLTEVPLGPAPQPVDDAIIADYVDAIVAALPRARSAAHAAPLRTVYTPLHGVGRDVLLRALAHAGFDPPQLVAAQAEPDPDFPTVPRPNPEEPGTLDLGLAEAERLDADLLLANDPDADRLAVAIPDRDGWRMLSGDEVGALLARHLLAHCDDPGAALLITTVASSSLLGQMAKAAGVAYRETLTGFKWIMRAVADAAPRRLLFAYEEALGYAVSDVVRDKDGISAALAMCQLAMEARASGTTPAAQLDELARRFGLHATRQVAVALESDEGPGRARRTMQRLRARPPARIAGRAVTEVEDLLRGERLPPADVLVVRCGDGLRVVVRPSGTEPRLKAYLEVIVPVAGEDMARARERADRQLEESARAMRELLGE